MSPMGALSRCMRDGINVLADWCDRGLRVVSVTQQIDFSGAMGKMLAAVLLGVAEMALEKGPAEIGNVTKVTAIDMV